MRDPAALLEQHARDAFRGSDSLFQAVMQDEQAGNSRGNRDNAQNNRQGSDQMSKHQACEEFYRAARDYSRALQVSCSSTKQAGGQNSASIGSEVCAENTAKVALINHAVGEAVAGVALHQMLKHHGERDKTTQALESHAEQMIASSQKAIDSIDRNGATAASRARRISARTRIIRLPMTRITRIARARTWHRLGTIRIGTPT